MLYILVENYDVSIPQAVWIACNGGHVLKGEKGTHVSIPQAVWIACNEISERMDELFNEVSIPQAVWIACNHPVTVSKTLFGGFNTASGMDCMQLIMKFMNAFSFQFQYRKRYGLHAIIREMSGRAYFVGFQYRKRYGLHAIRGPLQYRTSRFVSIPQAVWIACNCVKI